MYEVETRQYCKIFQATFDDLSKMGTMVSVCERELKSKFPECVHFSDKAHLNIYGDPYYSKSGEYKAVNRIAVICTAHTQIPTYSEEMRRYIGLGGAPTMILIPDEYIKKNGVTYKYLVAYDLYNPNREESDLKYHVGFQNHSLPPANVKYVWKITEDVFNGMAVFKINMCNQKQRA